MIRDIAFQVAVAEGIPSAAHAVGTVNGTGVDTNFANGVRMLLSVGDVGVGGTIEAKLQDSDDDGATDAYADVTGATTGVLGATGFDSSVINFSLLGGDTVRHKRFVRVVFVVAVDTVNASAVLEVYGHKLAPNPL